MKMMYHKIFQMHLARTNFPESIHCKTLHEFYFWVKVLNIAKRTLEIYITRNLSVQFYSDKQLFKKHTNNWLRTEFH